MAKKYYCYIPAYKPRIIEAETNLEALDMYNEGVEANIDRGNELEAVAIESEMVKPDGSREWECTTCGATCSRHYEDIVADGVPQCAKCDDDMSLVALDHE